MGTSNKSRGNVVEPPCASTPETARKRSTGLPQRHRSRGSHHRSPPNPPKTHEHTHTHTNTHALVRGRAGRPHTTNLTSLARRFAVASGVSYASRPPRSPPPAGFTGPPHSTATTASSLGPARIAASAAGQHAPRVLLSCLLDPAGLSRSRAQIRFSILSEGHRASHETD